MNQRIGRRDLLAFAAAAPLAAPPPARPATMPLLYVSHAAPLFVENDPVRIGALNAWGQTIPKPTGIIAMTPHFASRRPLVGATGRGVAMRNLPPALAQRVAPELSYATPPSEGLAKRIAGIMPLEATTDRPGFDHTTWMPLACLFVKADVPVIELAYPYVQDAALFELGKKLAPLRDEGILFFASGGVTHNLAMAPPQGTTTTVPAWTKEFDEWAAERIEARDVDSLVDWRYRAPANDLAHPDDGAHFRVLLVALGLAAGSSAGLTRTRFPIVGYDGALSKRCVEIV